MGFAHAQASAVAVTNGASTSTSVVLTNNPAATDVVAYGFTWFNGAGGLPASLVLADANSNSPTKSPNSPGGTNAISDGQTYAYYINNAPANLLKTMTATYTNPGAGGAAIFHADDFTVSGGTSAFDLDSVGSGASGGTITSPSVTRSGSNELLFFYAGSQNGISSVNSPWTQGGIDSDGNATGYILSASADTAVAATQSSGTWDAVGLSFSFSASGGSPDQIWAEDASNQPVEPEEWSEVQGFTADPLQPNLPAQVDQLISYFQDEAEEPAEEWLWPDYWAQAPPIPDAVSAVFVEDSSLQPVEHEEQHEVQDFLAVPLSPNAPAAQDQIQVEDSDNQPEEDEFAEGFSDAPQTILVADQIYVEDASLQPVEDDEFLEGLTDAQIDNYDIVQSLQEQPFEEDEAEGFSDAPLAADFSADFIQGEDASAQPDELDDADGQDYSSAPLSDDAIIDADYIEPYDDASSQPDELDDADSQDFVVAPLSDDAPPSPPVPSLVITPGKLPPWPWTWTHDQKQPQQQKTVDYSRDIERAMLLEQRLRAERRRLEQELRAKAAQKPNPKASAPERAQQISLQNRDYAILRRKIKAAEAEHAAAVTREIELRLKALENEQTVSETVAARRKRELMMVLLLA